MIVRSGFYIKIFSLNLLILLGLFSRISAQDKSISGVVNKYMHVTAIGPGSDNVTVDNVDQIQAGDTVLLIQMKGVSIEGLNAAQYGNYLNSVGTPGESEFLIILSVNTVTRNIVFTNNILKNYDAYGAVQLIKVPFYNSARVIADLTCQPWDSIAKTGGVLTMIVGRTLTLQANIDVTGKGFYGGTPYQGIGNLCISTDQALYDKFSYPESYMSSGYKGESPVSRVYVDPEYFPYNPDYVKGKGSNLSGGGGGSGKFSGGGGGANYGAGGRGGLELLSCAPEEYGGLGGKSIIPTDFAGGLLLGSGGGSSTYESAPTATPGGRGGGIIIILCDTLIGNGNQIKAEGASPVSSATGNAGAGGGGGGGSIALYQQSFSVSPASALTISVSGGKGGNNAGQFGEGGGGGGGYIITNNITPPANVSKNFLGGLGGTRSNGSGFAGLPGQSLTTFVPLLNGFLFNSIRSTVTGNQMDSICSNIPFGIISGTIPVGGVAPYTYLWESSTVSESAGFAAAAGVNNGSDYTPGLLTQTTWFRRIVTDNGAPVITDISKPVKIIYQPAITGNLVGKDTIICYNQNPLSLIPLTSPANGSSSNYYLYKWIQNNTNTNWNTSPAASGTSVNAGYDPPSLTNTTYYQRVVTSGRCVDYSATVTVTVLPSITGNITTRSDSIICEGSLFTNLSASAPAGGDDSFTYLWQDSIASGVWTNAVNVNNGLTYTPDTATFASVENRFFRRVVFSGADSVCRSPSSPLQLTRYHKIETNTIGSPDLICSGSSPAPLTGSVPTGGTNNPGDFIYQWQNSTDGATFADIPGATSVTYSAPTLTDTTWYRRIVNSSECTNTSPHIRIDVHKPVLNNIVSLLSGGSDTTICNGATPRRLAGTIPTGGTDIPGDYAYLWQVSNDNSTWTAVAVNGTSATYTPLALTQTTYYKRQVVSGECNEISASTVKITVLPLIANNVLTGAQTVCYNTIPALLNSPAITGGEDGNYNHYWEQSPDGVTWSAATGTNNVSAYQPPALIVPMKYRRIVSSGNPVCCIDTSNVIDIGINALPTGLISNTADTTICGGSQIELKVQLTGAGPWNVTFRDIPSSVEMTVSVATSNGIPLIPASPIAHNTYNYTISKLVDNNLCEATSLTGTKKADVYKVPVANAGQDMEVCGTTVTLAAIPTSGAGQWYDGALVLGTTPSLTATLDPLNFLNGKASRTYTWEETNWQCKSTDDVSVSFDQSVSSINAGNDTTIYSFDKTVRMAAAPVSNVWENGYWATVTGPGNAVDVNDNRSLVEGLTQGLNTMLWTIENGLCKVEDAVDITVNEVFIPEGFSPNHDGINDIFVIAGLDDGNQFAELKIINGAGAEVFSTSNSGKEWSDWDGTNSRGIDLPEGTYYYLLKLISKNNNQVFEKSGFVVLRRK